MDEILSDPEAAEFRAPAQEASPDSVSDQTIRASKASRHNIVIDPYESDFPLDTWDHGNTSLSVD